MPNEFVTRNVARTCFWQAIHYVCPDAFEDLASLVDDYLAFVENEWATDRRKRKKLEEDNDDPDSAKIIDWDYVEQGTVFRWQHRWNLDGNKEIRWVSYIAIGSLAGWAFEPDLHWKSGYLIPARNTSRPVFQLPDLEIGQQEDWADFRQRAEQVFKNTLAEYRNAVKDVGAFQQNIWRDARCLAAHQVAGQSWREVAKSMLEDGEFVDDTTVRKAANRFAAFLQLTLRT